MEKSAGATSEKVRNHIPDDLALSILSKLPLKSLKRFGCVCKSWALLFEDPHFMNIFRNNFISNHHSYYDDTSLLLQHTARVFYSLSGERFENLVKLDWPNPSQQEDPFFFILDSGSITGTLCLYKRGEEAVLWNPATEEFKVIPPSLESLPPPWGPLVYLHGFGYDHVRDDYKLIRYVCFVEETGPEFDDLDVPLEYISYDPLWEIYSLRSNSWRKLDVNVPTSNVTRCFGSAAGERLYMDGICHWWGLSLTHEHGADLVSFDLSKEVFLITHLPSEDGDDSLDIGLVSRYLVVLNGSIALILWHFGMTTFHISILGELGVKESWTKLFIVGPLPCLAYPIGAGKKGDIFFRKKDGELVWFDLSTHMIMELGVKGDDVSHIVIYKENLLPIGG